MKQLVCEMCGSRELVKQDGYFVCQSCGLKYTVEEARKMMIEGTVEVQGTVDVQGTVTVDNRELVEKYLANARRAKKKEDWEETEKYYNLVEQNEPSNIEAIFYSSYAKARILLIETDYFKREHAFKVLGNTVSIIDENYTPGNFETLKAIGADIDGITSSDFIYKGNERDKITETYKLFCQLHVTWIESLTNIGQREEVTDEERREIYLLAVHHYEVAREIQKGELFSIVEKTCISIAHDWLFENDLEYKAKVLKVKERERQSKIIELQTRIATAKKEIESNKRTIDLYPLSREMQEQQDGNTNRTVWFSMISLVIGVVGWIACGFWVGVGLFFLTAIILFPIIGVIENKTKEKYEGIPFITKEQLEAAKRDVQTLSSQLESLSKELAELQSISYIQ